MAYAKRYAGGFNDLGAAGGTPADSTFLNAVETSLLRHDSVDPTADGQVLQWIAANSKYGPALLLNKNVDPAAAIDKSKLNLAGQINNADIAGAAAIDRSKLNFGSGLVNADISAAAAISLSKLSGAYTAYTPAWTAPTPPAIGNGTIIGKYIQIGKMVVGQIRIVMGSTTTFGVGVYSFSLPVTSTAVTFFACGSGYIYDSSANSLWTTVVLQGSTTTLNTDITGAAAAYLVGGAAAPFAWATNDEINLTFTYEAA
jgi:hypothetical protein